MNIKQTTQHRKKWVDVYKASNGCSACGYNKHPSALCFDHLPEHDKHDQCKSGSKAGGMFMLYHKKYSVTELITEIKKCRLLCHNCHMEQTYKKTKVVCRHEPMPIEELELKLGNDNV